jgi:hypothetical protein
MKLSPAPQKPKLQSIWDRSDSYCRQNCGDQHNRNKPMKTTTNITYSALALFALGCFGLSPQARAVCQEGCDTTKVNTFLGEDALLNNTTGFRNTAIGHGALQSNTTGFLNTGVGTFALFSNTTGSSNTAIGDGALVNAISGENTAIGTNALFENTTGDQNTAIGFQALFESTSGRLNTAVGEKALYNNRTGGANTAIGWGASFNGGEGNTAIGFNALNPSNGNNNIAVGASAGANLTEGSDNIDIGNAGVAGELGVIRIGTAGTQTATFIAGIRETPLAHGVAVGVGITANGQLGVRASSARFKEAIKPMDNMSEAIFSLKPVTFRYKKDPAATAQFGLVAEEVAKVHPDLVARDPEGKPFTVRYDEINTMLLNEFLKEHRKGQEQDATISQLKAELTQQHKAIQALTATLKAQAAQIQKVSDQLATNQTGTPLLAENR